MTASEAVLEQPLYLPACIAAQAIAANCLLQLAIEQILQARSQIAIGFV